jgi:nicotinamide riboside kinase
MKIALIGTHGVGKTTLCYELAARLKRRDVDVELVREVARRCPLPINRDTSRDAQAWILHTQMAWELEAQARGAVVLCDRSVLDNFCYLLYAAGPQPAWEPLLSAWMPTYDLLIKVPAWTPPRWDGVRDTDTSFQRRIDELLDEQLARRGLAHVALQEAQRERWGELVLSLIIPRLHPMPLLFPDSEVDAVEAPSKPPV